MKTIFTFFVVAMLPFMVSAQNLITNPSFEDDLTGWNNLANDNGVAEFTIDSTDSPDGAKYLQVDVTTAGEKLWSIQSLSTPFDVVPGKTYTVSFMAKASGADASLFCVVQDNGVQKNITPALTETWTAYTFDLPVATDSTVQVKLKFHYRGLGTYSIDKISVVDSEPTSIDSTSIVDSDTTSIVNAQNLVINPGFEDDLVDWQSLSADNGVAEFTVGSTDSPEGTKHLQVEVTTIGENLWSIQSVSAPLPLVGAKTYTLTFMAKAIGTDALLFAVVQGGGVQKGMSPTLTETWTAYTFDVPVDAEPTGDVNLKFHYRGLGTYSIDNISIVDSESTSIDSTSIVDETAIYKLENKPSAKFYPNPFTNQLTIGSNEGIEEITIYNSLGEVVLKQTDLKNVKNIQGLDILKTGLYFIDAVTLSGEIITSRVIKK